MTSSLQIFDTLTGKKQPFTPSDGNVVRIYACGPTVYDLSHLGHARMAITWDVIQRYLRFLGYDVIFVRNITDIDDKIIRRAKELGMRPERLARMYTYEFWRDMDRLNVQMPDYEPRATEFIAPMVKFIEELIAAGHAYQAGGDVYFDVKSFEAYGKLSKQDVEQLIVGSREQVRSQEELLEVKRSPVDFALWKAAPDAELGWNSPWGRGRPGWHLECSTMIRNVLGETIDIHGGGEDLMFPHHENEIAQSESLLKKPLARYWMHNSFVQINAEKMSKSLGNFSTIQDLLATFEPDAIRLLLLQTHYRNPIDFTVESLYAARSAVQRLTRAAAQIDESANGSGKEYESVKQFESAFTEAMNNDFNTAVALSEMFGLADKIAAASDSQEKAACAAALKKYAGVLGLSLVDNRKSIDAKTAERVIDLTLELRQSARKNKDFATADRIRKELTEIGINVMDTAGGSTWERS